MPRGSLAAIEMPSVEFAHDVLAETVNLALPGKRDERHLSRLSRFEPYRRAGRNIESHAAGLRAIEGQRRIGLEEMVVRTYLDRSIPGIGHREGERGSIRVEDNIAVLSEDFAGNHLTCRFYVDATHGFGFPFTDPC